MSIRYSPRPTADMAVAARQGSAATEARPTGRRVGDERVAMSGGVGGDGRDEITNGVEQIRAIAATPDRAAREGAITAFISARYPALRRQARRLCSVNAVPASTYLDDVLQIVLEAAWRLLRSLAEDPAQIESLPSFEQRVWVTARPLVRSELDKAKSPASGMVSVQRRAREVRRTQLEMMSRGHSAPTVEEVITATNDRLRALRADAARQGLLVTAADITAAEAPAALDSPDAADRHVAAHDPTATDMARRVLSATRKVDEETYRTARIYVKEALGPSDPNRPDVTRLVAADLKVNPRRARTLIRRVVEIARAELRASGYGPGGQDALAARGVASAA